MCEASYLTVAYSLFVRARHQFAMQSPVLQLSLPDSQALQLAREPLHRLKRAGATNIFSFYFTIHKYYFFSKTQIVEAYSFDLDLTLDIVNHAQLFHRPYV